MRVREPVAFWRENANSCGHSTMCFSATVVLAGKKLSNVRGFIDFLRSAEGVASFKGENSANPSGKKKYNEASGVSTFFLEYAKKAKNQISYSWSF